MTALPSMDATTMVLPSLKWGSRMVNSSADPAHSFSREITTMVESSALASTAILGTVSLCLSNALEAVGVGA